MIDLEILLTSLSAYFVLVDPLGASLIFNALTKGHDSAYCRNIAFRAVALSFVVIIGFGFFGATLLGRLGITMEAFRIAGGLLLSYTAFRMVVQPDTPSEEGATRTPPSNEIAVFPLSIPLMAGPGCLTLTILLFSKSRQADGGILSVVLAIVLILTTALISFLLSRKIAAAMGGTVNAIVKRLLGVLLAALSIQFIVDGIMGLISQSPM
jgi:multiple antibiotic resistance protein